MFARQHRRRRSCAPRIARIRAEAEDAVRQGYNHLILTDERIDGDLAADPDDPGDGRRAFASVATGLAHLSPRINVRSAECLDTHYFAVLIGVGATTVNAYLAQESHRRPPRARPVRQAGARRMREALSRHGERGPAQDHLEDGHLGDLVLSRRVQFRGDRPFALDGRRYLPRHDEPHLRHRPSPASPRKSRASTRKRLRRRRPPRCRSAASIARASGETHAHSARTDPSAAKRGVERFLQHLQQIFRRRARRCRRSSCAI